MKLNGLIRQIRHQKKLSQSQLAKYAGITQAMLSRFENGEDVRLSTARQITEASDLRLIAVPKENIESINRQLFQISEPEPESLLEKYGIGDDDD